jgi:hypothetical protein
LPTTLFRPLRIVLAVTLIAAVAPLVAASTAVAGPADVTCTDAFSGIARDVTVTGDEGCDLSGATITRDLIIESETGAFADGLTVGRDVILAGHDGIEFGGATIGHDLKSGTAADMHLERTTIGHDLVASEPSSVQTGHNAPDSPGGPVRVGHDVTINGSPPDQDFVFDGMCSLTVGHDFTMTNRSVTLGVGLGDNCVFRGELPNTIGHDLIFRGNTALSGFFGPSALEVGDNQVGHDLVFTNNSAVPGGYLEVADNIVAHDAICSGNDPAPTGDAFDGPNIVGGTNTCG